MLSTFISWRVIECIGFSELPSRNCLRRKRLQKYDVFFIYQKVSMKIFPKNLLDE